MKPYKQYLKEVGKRVFTAPVLTTWEVREVKQGFDAIFFAVGVVIARAVIAVLAPVSIPLIALIAQRQGRA
jgi:hypothetical protein